MVPVVSELLIRRENQTNLNNQLKFFKFSAMSEISDGNTNRDQQQQQLGKGGLNLFEKSVIILRDENGFGLRIKGDAPVFIDHVHENGAAWRAGVREFDYILKINGQSIEQMSHKEVVLMFKSCSKFIALTLLVGPKFSETPQIIHSAPMLVANGQFDAFNNSDKADQGLVGKQLELSDNSSYSIQARDKLLKNYISLNYQPSIRSFRGAEADESFRGRTKINLSSLPATPPIRADCVTDKSKQALSSGSDNLISNRGRKLIDGNNREPEEWNDGKSSKLLNMNNFKIRTRLAIIKEFIETEKTHMDRLKCLDELFYKPLKANNLMTSEQLRLVFSCHRHLYKIHRQIYKILLSVQCQQQQLRHCQEFAGPRVREQDLQSITMVGSALMEIFEGQLKRRLERAASAFCSAQSTNNELLNKLLRKDSKVGEFIAAQVLSSQQMIGRLGLKDLLASCFQRLTKYPLLLENLLKATPNLTNTIPNQCPSRGPQCDASKRDCSESGAKTLSSNEEDADSAEENDGQDEFEDEDEDDENGGDRGQNRDDFESEKKFIKMLTISLAEEREFIERALRQSKQIVNNVNIAISMNRLREIWSKTERASNLQPTNIDVTNQQVLHEGSLTLRLFKKSFDVYVVLMNNYLIILTKDGQDRFKLKPFAPSSANEQTASLKLSLNATNSSQTPAINSSSSNQQSIGLVQNFSTAQTGIPSDAAAPATGSNVPPSGGDSSSVNRVTLPAQHMTNFSPVFVIDEHLTTRDDATDENGFYLLCKRKDDSRIYVFSSKSPNERLKWTEKIKYAIDCHLSSLDKTMARQRMDESGQSKAICARRSSCDNATSITISSQPTDKPMRPDQPATDNTKCGESPERGSGELGQSNSKESPGSPNKSPERTETEPTKIEGTISYVEDDGIVMPSKMESSRVQVDRAVQVTLFKVNSHDKDMLFSSINDEKVHTKLASISERERCRNVDIRIQSS